MNPLAAFPIMMVSSALVMPIGGRAVIRSGRYNLPAAVGLAIGGIPGVLIAAYVVKSLPIVWLRWLVVVVVLYAEGLMLSSHGVPMPITMIFLRRAVWISAPATFSRIAAGAVGRIK